VAASLVVLAVAVFADDVRVCTCVHVCVRWAAYPLRCRGY
jgi:hypothetical protein